MARRSEQRKENEAFEFLLPQEHRSTGGGTCPRQHSAKRTPQHMASGYSETHSAKDSLESSASRESAKYMQEVEAWFDSTILRGDQETDEQYRKRVLNALKGKLVESCRSGRNSLAAW
jgi:hypothetical protein